MEKEAYLDKIRAMMNDMVRVLEAVQRKARDDIMEEADSVHGGL